MVMRRGSGVNRGASTKPDLAPARPSSRRYDTHSGTSTPARLTSSRATRRKCAAASSSLHGPGDQRRRDHPAIDAFAWSWRCSANPGRSRLVAAGHRAPALAPKPPRESRDRARLILKPPLLAILRPAPMHRHVDRSCVNVQSHVPRCPLLHLLRPNPFMLRSGSALMLPRSRRRYRSPGRRGIHTVSPSGRWVRVFGDEKLTTALLDRLGHRAHILTTRGISYRTRHAPRTRRSGAAEGGR